MFKRIFFATLFLFLLTNCVPNRSLPINQQSKITLTLISTSVPTSTVTPMRVSPTAKASWTPLPIKLPSPPSVQELKFFTLDVHLICPEQQEVSFAELGIDPDFHLLVYKINNPGGVKAEMLSGSESTLSEVPNSQVKEGWSLYAYGPSQSGKWIELYYRDHDETGVSIWLSTPDGDRQWKVTTLNHDVDKITKFISDEELIIIGIPRDRQSDRVQDLRDFIPLTSINTFTGDAKELASLPDHAVFDFYFQYEGKSYAVYYSGEQSVTSYFLFDYSNASSTPILQWLQGETGHFLEPGIGIRKNGLFFISLDRPYGFDTAIDLSFEDLFLQTTYNEVMKAIVLPGDEDTTRTSVYYWVTQNAFPVLRNEIIDIIPETIYWFDYQQMIIKDYCLEIIPSGGMSTSPDERFLSTTLFRVDDDNLIETGSIVLDTKTGKYSLIDGYASIGWVISNTDDDLP